MNDEHPPSRRSRNLFQQFIHFFNKQSSKADVREYLQEAQDNNILAIEEAAMMAGVLAVSEQRVRDVMVAKSKMVTVPFDLGFAETLNLVMESGHSRFPVEKDEEIIGILLAKDLLNHVHAQSNGESADFQIINTMRSVRHIPESKPLDILLREFRLQRLHMMIVTNEYGETAGLITIEDVLEEIVGEIDDEHDDETDEEIKKLDSNSYLVEALTEVEDFNTYFKTDLDLEANDTIGGFVLSHFGYVPAVGERVNFANMDFIVKTADDRRILSLVVKT